MLCQESKMLVINKSPDIVIVIKVCKFEWQNRRKEKKMKDLDKGGWMMLNQT
jgi:hypothetical protein